MQKEMATTLKKRLFHIDLLRFLAAFYVLFYHYCFRGFSKDGFSIVQYAPMEDWSKYGYLGVDLFFIISGFVILMSALNSDLTKFMISRFSRLYPAYWFCLIFTAIVIVLFGSPLFEIEPLDFVANLTMLNGFFEIPYVDGVYWSLLVELKFYILIGFILLFHAIKHIKILALLLLGLAILQLIVPFKDAPFILKLVYFITFPRWSSYFIAGMFFFLMYQEGKKWTYILTIIICYFVSLQYAFLKVDYMNEMYTHHFSYYTAGIFISVFYFVFYLISTERLNFLNKKYFLAIGGLTYPLYLIHQNVGYIALNYFSIYLNKWILLSLLIGFMLTFSFFINKVIEKPLGTYFRKKLSENKYVLSLKSKLNTIYTRA